MSLLRILLAEDSPTDAKLIARELKNGGELDLTVVDSEEAMRAAFARAPFDAVLSDFEIPGFGVLQALAIARSHDANLPFIVVSGTIGEERAVDVMRAGANDYVLKDRMARLRPALEREIREAASRRARQGAEESVSRQERRFRAMLDKSAEVVVLIDVHALVTQVLL